MDDITLFFYACIYTPGDLDEREAGSRRATRLTEDIEGVLGICARRRFLAGKSADHRLLASVPCPFGDQPSSCPSEAPMASTEA
jgi:hypothetical protein